MSGRKINVHLRGICCLLSVIGLTGTGCDDDSAGKNALKCEAGMTACGGICCAKACCDGICTDTATSDGHCGACGNVCGESEICMDSVCLSRDAACTAPKKLCERQCTDTDSDTGNCGECGHRCDDFEECRDGECRIICDAPRILCGTDCVDPKRDAGHCGNCETVCGGNMYCADGVCACPIGTSDCDGNASNGCETNAYKCPVLPECGEGTTACGDGCCSATCCPGDICIDTQSDPMNCGECGHECQTTQICAAGRCESVEVTCDDDIQKVCYGQCVYLNGDAKNCGQCGHICAEDEWCEGGSCVKADVECAPYQKMCFGVCKNIAEDVENCGRCDHMCAEGEICRQGKCVDDPALKCAPGEIVCFGNCVDAMSSAAHCGTCTTSCAKGEICSKGKCIPDCGDRTLCGSACADTASDKNNCGACGTVCLPGEKCEGGGCVCEKDRFDCDGDASNGCESSEACACTPGEKRACWRGPAEKRGLGICRDGQQVCDASGNFWGPCTGGIYPTNLTCDVYGNLNGKDNDCDGKIDTVCRSECDLEAGDMSYIGCEYWSAYLYNLIPVNHTIVLSNPGTEPAEVYIFDKKGFEGKPQKPLFKVTVPPKEVKAQEINTALKNMCSSTSIFPNAYRIRSNHPITAYQFNPWGNSDAHSNDASLLLPALALGNEYIGMTWKSKSGGEQGSAHTSYMTVIATEPGKTKVTVKTPCPIVASGVYDSKSHNMPPTAIPAMKAGETRTFELERFDVLTLNTPPESVDPTGMTIKADKNVAVFGGSRSSYVPLNAGCCRDHIEEQLFPLKSWGKSYYAARAYSRGKAGDFWRIMAQKDDTKVTLPKSLGGVKILKAGQLIEFETRESFEVHADKPISVGQFLPSQGYNGLNIGDPSFILTVPYEQYRDDYAFMVPPSFDENYVTVIAPEDAKITVDGKKLDISKYKKIAGTDFVVGYETIEPGMRRMNGDKPFGLYNYGYFNMSSYGYPIGLDLRAINTN